MPQLPLTSHELRVVHEYRAATSDELDLDPGERVEEVGPGDPGWTRVRKEDGQEGLVPTDYVARWK